MGRGVNKVTLIGLLGNDPDVKTTATGLTITNISLATSEQWKDKQSGEQKERTEWHRVTFFGNLAEIVGKYQKKGSQIYVEGRLQTDKWQDKDGNDRYTTKIMANEMQMLSGSKALQGASESAKPAAKKDYEAAKNGYQPEQPSDDIPF